MEAFTTSAPYHYNNSAANIVVPLTLTLPLWVTLLSTQYRYRDYLRSLSSRQSISRHPSEEIFDFIVVGSGSSGSVVANCLSKFNTVLLLELGGDPLWVQEVTLPSVALQRCPGVDLMYETVRQNNSANALHNNVVFWPRGAGLGGSTLLNPMIYQRGNSKDYDNWVKITGGQHWLWKNVSPVFKKLEDYEGAYSKGKSHGTGGPMHVEKVSYSAMDDYFIQAGKEKKYGTMDPNIGGGQGFSPMEITSKKGVRWSTYRGYIRPILNRNNLKIYRYSRVIKVHLDKSRHAYGVTYIRHGAQYFARARKEIIISAGAIDSPKVLLLSGIGPKKDLNEQGLKCRVNLPVGRNLKDHPTVLMGPFLVDSKESIIIAREFSFMRSLQTVSDYTRSGKGFLASTSISALGYVSTSVNKNQTDWPDIQYTLIPIGIQPGFAENFERVSNFRADILREYYGPYLEKGHHANVVFMTLGKPKSTGYIKLMSRDPFVPPYIQPNYLQHRDDVQALVDGAKLLVDLYENTTVYKSINARLIPRHLPGCEKYKLKSDKYYECFVRALAATLYHPVGTCSMGKSSSNSVVDPELKVHKVKGLRVVDASVMPEIVNANTNVPCIMIGEVGSWLIRKYWQDQYLVCDKNDFLISNYDKVCVYSRLV